jgi:hypothetical protein
MPPVPDPNQEQEQSNMTPLYVSAMVEAVTKGVEAALRNAMVNRIPFASPNSKCTLWRRKIENEEVQNEKSTEPREHRDFILVITTFICKPDKR